MGLLIIVAIVVYIVFKFNGTNNNQNRIEVTCPYCLTRITVTGPGSWNCCSCPNTFQYQDGKVYKNDKLDNGLTALAKLFAKTCKADGSVSINEIKLMDDILRNSLELSNAQRKEFSDVFNEYKVNHLHYLGYIDELHNYYNSSDNGLYLIVEYLFMLAKIDNGISVNQEQIIRDTIKGFQATIRLDYDDFLGESSSEYQNASSFDSIGYYEILGCKESSSDQEVKIAYRNLVQQYHPDKYLSKDLPIDVVQYASDKFKEVQTAYSQIKELRGI